MSAIDVVRAVAAADHVVAASTVWEVVPTEADDHIRTLGAFEVVGAVRAKDGRGLAVAGRRRVAWWSCGRNLREDGRGARWRATQRLVVRPANLVKLVTVGLP